MRTQRIKNKTRVLAGAAASFLAIGLSFPAMAATDPGVESADAETGTTGSSLAGSNSASSSAAGLSSGAATLANATDSNTVTVPIFGITDFHGHIENGAYLATALKEMRAANPNTVFVGVGDLVGASPFESSTADDVPAFDQLREMSLLVSAVGNHEFDQGQDDFVGRIQQNLQPATYVSANLSGGSLDGNLDPYYIHEVDGAKIAFIGAIYPEVLSSVSPAGMVGVTVSDPVESVNYWAGVLSDGDESNGEADAVVALVHADGYSLTGLNENVDAVLSGHTHLREELFTGADAPIIEASSYGEAFSSIEFTFTEDSAGETVVDVQADYNSIYGEGGNVCYAADPTVYQIYEDALDAAAAFGETELGTIDANSTFNRASDEIGNLSGNGNNRGAESTLGNLQANAVLWATNQQLGEGSADIGIINAGGLRDDLDPDGDKIITYQEGYNVLPFGNTNAVVDLTGAQVVTLLEQQWQPAGASRPILWLGLSDNVTYKYEAYTEMEDGVEVPRARVFDVRVDGKPIDLTATYSVAGNSFLLAGGDNFTVLAEGTNYVDTGFLDFASFASYLQEHPGVAAAKSRLSTGFSDLTLDGNTLSMVMSGLAFTTDEAKPIAVDLRIAGVDFGVIEGVAAAYYEGVSNGPSAGYVTVIKTLTDSELAALQDYLVISEGSTAVSFTDDVTMEVQALFTQEEVEAALLSRQGTPDTPADPNPQTPPTEISGQVDDGAGAGTGDAEEEPLARTGASVLPLTLLCLLLAGGGLALAVRKGAQG